ncbi:DUF4247 domain-containing protein [Lentibacillus jeotgali]|uniref:DUF4247 domain-containing protein n=1 Tax=Lentibacillus jeotgali TaxID=558169 RepID=UPI0002626FB4|nr:DUF4247 domain-containing protein [Lentibacillus jeotgali]
MLKKWSICIGLLSLIILLTACSSRGGQQGIVITADDIPQETQKEEIIAAINQTANNEIDDIIEANFPLMDTVNGETNDAEIYATQQFELEELASVFMEAIEPEKVSDIEDNQQILIYPDHFITLRESDEDQDVVMIEVADDEFVRRNYSPNFLSTYFSIRLLESMLGADNWGSRQSGGYTGMGGTPGRGNTTFRGGGPGAGK